MYLYNSATHKKAEFTTHTPGHVEMYTCGPTVYHFAHIGNLRSYIMEDVLEKFLRYTGYSVNRVTVYIETPRNLNREQKDALKKFAESVGDNNYEERRKFFRKFKK